MHTDGGEARNRRLKILEDLRTRRSEDIEDIESRRVKILAERVEDCVRTTTDIWRDRRPYEEACMILCKLW